MKRDRMFHLQAAQDRFTRAAAAIALRTQVDDTNEDGLAFAFLEAGLGILALAEADEDNRAKDKLDAYLAAQRKRLGSSR